VVLVLEGQVEEDKVHLGVDKQQMCNHIAWRHYELTWRSRSQRR